MNKESVHELNAKLARFCAYQERSKGEVLQKLAQLGADQKQSDKVLKWLADEKYIDDARFAAAYARGKFRSNNWGKIAIAHGLRQRGIGQSMIERALEEIPESEYMQTACKLIKKKWSETAGDNIKVKERKVYTYMASKGFENDLIWDELKRLKCTK